MMPRKIWEPTGTCRYCGRPLRLAQDASEADHTESVCREEIDRRVAALLDQGVSGLVDIMYRLDEEGVYNDLSEYVVQNSINRVRGGG